MKLRTQPGGEARAIREFLQRRYFEPARRRNETLVTVRAGDIHRELGLRNRVPNVCQVMESKLLQKEAGVKVSSKQGPPSGRGTRLTVTYSVDLDYGTGREPGSKGLQTRSSMSVHPGVALFRSLRGLASDVYAAEGGSEAWMREERAEFYGPDKKDFE